MIKQKSGSIINVSSVRGEYGWPSDYAAYCASKGALNTFSKDLACEWAKYNVRVNIIAPTMVVTDLTRNALANPEFANRFLSRIPMGKFAQPEDTVGPLSSLLRKLPVILPAKSCTSTAASPAGKRGNNLILIFIKIGQIFFGGKLKRNIKNHFLKG